MSTVSLKSIVRSIVEGQYDPLTGETKYYAAGEEVSLGSGASTVYDYYIDGAAGDDSNDGSRLAPWKTLSKINTSIVSGQQRTILVMAGTYSAAGDYVECALPTDVSSDTRLDIHFEAGCVMDGTNASATSRNGFEFSGGAWTSAIYGNGLKVRNYADVSTGSSPNGVGNRGSHTLYVHDVHVSGCDDAFSTHDVARMFVYDSSGINGEKAAFANVGTAYAEYHRCEFRLTGTQNGATGQAKFYGSKLIPAADGVIVTFGADVLFDSECQLGTLSTRMQINCLTVGTLMTVQNSFVNLFVDGTTFAAFSECYGKMTTRQRNADGSGIRIDRCVFVGPASGSGIPSSTLHGANADFSGTIAPIVIEKSVLTGYTTAAIGGEMNATRAQKFVDSGSYVRDCCMSGNTLNIDADLVTVGADITGTITTAPALKATTNSYRKSDYAVTNADVRAAGIGF